LRKHIRVWDNINDPTGETYYDWNWYMDKYELELYQYYRIVHTLTGWNIPLLEYLEVVSPEDLATMPPEMYELLFNMGHITPRITPLFDDGYGSSSNSETTWWSVSRYHIWVSPDGEAFNGDLPPYQWLVWKGWEEYADHLPAPPEGAPFQAPEYKGTPRNTLPFARMDTRGFYNIDYEIENPCPDAIIDPIDLSEWDWTPEMKEHLANLGLDTDMGKTRLGYEKSGTTLTMVGMTPSGTMKEWTLKLSKGAWTCDSASAEKLEDMLVILGRIDAISGTALATPVPAVTGMNSLTSTKSLKLNKLSTSAPLKGVNFSTMQDSSLLSGKSTTVSTLERSGMLSGSGTMMQERSPASARTVQVSPKVRKAAGSA